MAITPAAFASTGSVLTATEYNYLPRGVVAFAQKTADQTGISAQADISSLSVTWTATSSRYYRTTIYLAMVNQKTSSGIVVTNLTDGASTTKTQANLSLGINEFGPVCCVSIETGLSGSITRKARIGTTAGTVDVPAASSTQGYYIVVEDLGIS